MEIEGIVADFHTIIINKDNQRRREWTIVYSNIFLSKTQKNNDKNYDL